MLIEVNTDTNVVIDEHRPLHGLTDVGDPRVTVFFRGCVDFVHLGLVRGGADEKHGPLLVSHLSHNQLLQ